MKLTSETLIGSKPFSGFKILIILSEKSPDYLTKINKSTCIKVGIIIFDLI